MAAGVAMVHQELAFCPDLSVAENLSMGRYPRKYGSSSTARGWPERARAMLAGIGAHFSVEQPMRDLSTAQEQLVQIAAAVGTNPRILVFDEPTSSLAEPDAQNLFLLIEDLKRRGHHDRLRLAPDARTYSACATASASCATGSTSAPWARRK